MNDTTEPAIYVADLAAYNAGVLHGQWITLSGLDADDVHAEIAKILADGTRKFGAKTGGVHEEFAIHDFEGFGPIRLGEYDSVDSVVAHVERMGDDADKYFAYVDATGDHCAEFYDADDVMGPYDSAADYAWERLDDIIGADTLSGWLIGKGMPEDLALALEFDADDYIFAMRCNTGASVGSWNGQTYIFGG
jgi:antirestriction protein